MEINEQVKNYIIENGERVKLKTAEWKEIAEEIQELFNIELTSESVRKRYSRLTKNKTNYNGGIREISKLVDLTGLSKEEKANQEIVLKIMGYDPANWELLSMSMSNWQQHTKEQTTKELYAVKIRIKPKVEELTTDKVIQIANKVIAQEVKPIKLPLQPKNSSLKKDKLFLSPAVELHLGKLGWERETTGTNYNHQIAKDRFRKITEEEIKEQQFRGCDRCLMVIGNDFFNSEANNKTTAGTDQQNDSRYQKLFEIGVNLYKEKLINFKQYFNKIDVIFCPGNHARAMEFFLYDVLEAYFKEDDVINFSPNKKTTQDYVFGKTLLMFNHGDINYNRLIKSVVQEFAEDYGRTIHRYLILGHLHCKQKDEDEQIGLIIQRLSSCCENDEWHSRERYLAKPKYEFMIYDKENGLESIHTINFFKKKDPVRSRK